MEPVTLGIMAVLALFFVIVALAAFRMLTKETNFEDVYGENAMRLFAEEKSGKQKTTKGNKNKGRNNDKKKDNSADKEQKRAEREKHHEKKTEGSSTEVAKPLETMSDSEPGRNGEAVSLQEMKHTKKKNRNKHQQEENKIVEAMQSEKENDALQGLENTEPLMVQTPRQPEAVVESIPLIDEIAVAEGMEKKGKKKRARRSEDHIREVTKEEVQPLKNESKLEDLLPPQTVKEEKRVEKPRPKKAAVSVQDITTDKLHARLSAIEDLEAEYLSFLATYFSDTSMQKTKLSEENALLRKQIADKERLVLQCTDKLSAAQKKDADIAHLQQSLSEEKKKYTLFEQSVCTQLSASVKDKNYLQHLNEQLRSEASNLKEELKKTQAALKAVPPPVDTTAFQQQADMLRSELNTAKKKASQLESELSQRTQALQQMKSDLQGHEIQMEHLKQASAVSEKRFKEAEAASKMEREFLEAKLNDTLKAMEELQTLVNTAREEAQKRAVSAQSAVQDCKNEFAHQLESLKHQLAKVEKERDMLKVDNERSFATFSQKDVQHKNELMKLNDEIVELRRMAEDERSKFSSEIDEKTGEVAELRKQANELHKQCEQESALLSTFREKLREAEQAANLDRTKVSRLEKELAEAKAHLDAKEAANDAQLKELQAELDMLKKAPPAVSLMTPADTPDQEEVIGLSRVRGLGAVANDMREAEAELEDLKRALADQQRRNDELREANYRIVEVSQKQEQMYVKRLQEVEKKCEQKLRDERKLAIATMKFALPSSVKVQAVPQSCTEQDYKQWIANVSETLKKYVASNKPATSDEKHEKSPPKNALAPDSEGKIKELEQKVERYRVALAAVSSSIDTIEQEAAQKQKNYEREIAQLKKEINQGRILSGKAQWLKEKNMSLDKRVGDLKRQLEYERGNGEQLNEQAAKLREMLGASVEKDPRRHRHRGGRHHKDSWNRDKGTSKRRVKCLSESAAHVPVNNGFHSSGSSLTNMIEEEDA
uniref:Ribosome-binding protein 1 n=1 Tax=Parascaris univalens TaxID=6257 RepID=A0A915B2M2_PARUN